MYCLMMQVSPPLAALSQRAYAISSDSWYLCSSLRSSARVAHNRRHAGKQDQGSYRAQRSHRSLRITKGYALQNGESLPNVQLFLR